MQVRKQKLELDMEQQTGSKWEKEYVKAVKRHTAAKWQNWGRNPGKVLKADLRPRIASQQQGRSLDVAKVTEGTHEQVALGSSVLSHAAWEKKELICPGPFQANR